MSLSLRSQNEEIKDLGILKILLQQYCLLQTLLSLSKVRSLSKVVEGQRVVSLRIGLIVFESSQPLSKILLGSNIKLCLIAVIDLAQSKVKLVILFIVNNLVKSYYVIVIKLFQDVDFPLSVQVCYRIFVLQLRSLENFQSLETQKLTMNAYEFLESLIFLAELNLSKTALSNFFKQRILVHRVSSLNEFIQII